MRAPLLSLIVAAALAVAAAACFDWDGFLQRCQAAGNCLPPGGSDGGDAGDGGGDAGDGGSDGGGGSRGDAGRGQSCSGNPDCTSGACSPNGFCTCVVNGPCHGDQDCCLGQTCLPSLPVGTCSTDILSPCGGAGAGCGGPGQCCSTCNGGSLMCDCSPNGFHCNLKDDCCSGTAQCSAGKYCCEPSGTTGCTMDEQCCSRVCRSGACQ